MKTLRQLILAFADDDSAQRWGGEPEDFADAPDCDVMSKAFANLLTQYGHDAEAVELRTSSLHDGLVGPEHWVTVTSEGIAIDWTARQFHNADGVNLDPSEIPCPLLFVWGGQYPIPTIIIEEAS